MRTRTASTVITLFGGVTNTILTIQVLAAWRSIKWEPESEWELSGDKWQVTGVKIIWALLSLYFASAAAVCFIGLHGVLKHKPSLVRFYRDYSIADFSFSAFFTALATYGAFLGPARVGICEELSRHPDLMRNLTEIGLNLENCELWLSRAVFVGLAVMFFIMVIRLHFLLAVSTYYSHLARHYPHHHQRSPSCTSSCIPSSSSSSSLPTHSLKDLNSSLPSSNSMPMQRILVLPKPAPGTASIGFGANPDLEPGVNVEMVYAPVPKHTLPKELQEQATEAWIPSSSSSSAMMGASMSMSMMPSASRTYHHRRHHHHRSSHSYSHASSHTHAHAHAHAHAHTHRHRSSSRETTGRIKLDIAPGEGLLAFRDDVKEL